MTALSVITEYAIRLTGRWLLLSALFCSAAQLLADDTLKARELVDEMICALELPCADADQSSSGGAGTYGSQIHNLDIAYDLARSYWVAQLAPEMSDPNPRQNSQLLRFSESTFMATVLWYMISIEVASEPHNEFLSEEDIKSKLASQGALAADPVDEIINLLSRMNKRRSHWLKGLPLELDPPLKEVRTQRFRSFYRHYQLGYLSRKYLFGREYRTRPPEKMQERLCCSAIQEFWLNDPLSTEQTIDRFSRYRGEIPSKFQPFSAWLAGMYGTGHTEEGPLAILCRNYSGWLLYLMAIYDVIRNPEGRALQLAKSRKRKPMDDGEELYLTLVMGLAVTTRINQYHLSLLSYLAEDPLRKEEEKARLTEAAGLRVGRIGHYMHNMQSMHSGQQTMPTVALETMRWLNEGGDNRPAMFRYELFNSVDFSMLMAIRIAGTYRLLQKTENERALDPQLQVFGAGSSPNFPLWCQYWTFQGMVLRNDQLLVKYLTGSEQMSWISQQLMEEAYSNTPGEEALTSEPKVMLTAQGLALRSEKQGTTAGASASETNTPEAQNFEQAFLSSLINPFQESVLTNMQQYHDGLLTDPQYRKKDHACFNFKTQHRYQFYQRASLSPIGPIHWMKVKCPDGDPKLEERYKKKANQFYLNREMADIDDIQMVYLNSCFPTIVSFTPLNGSADEVAIFPDTEEIVELLRRSYVSGGEYKLTTTEKIVWKKVDVKGFNSNRNELVPAELPLLSNRDGDTSTEIAKATPDTRPRAPIFANTPEILAPPPPPTPAVKAIDSRLESQIKRHAIEGYDIPGYVFHSNLKNIPVARVLPLPDRQARVTVLREGGNGIILKVTYNGYGINMAFKKTMFRWREVLISSKLNHKNLLKTQLMIMGGPQENFPRRRLVYHGYPLYHSDLGRAIGSYERYCLRSLLSRYRNELLLQKKILTNFIHFFGEITSALVYLHENNIIHRDIKPSNILFNPKKGCKCSSPIICSCSELPEYVLSDFDASLELHKDGTILRDPPRSVMRKEYFHQETCTYHLSSVGTTGFKSPEAGFYQVANDVSLMPEQPCQMDIYGFGAVAALLFYNEESAKYPIDWARELLVVNVGDKECNPIDLKAILMKNGVTLDGISDEQFKLKNALFASEGEKVRGKKNTRTYKLERSYETQKARFKESSADWPLQAQSLAEYALSWVRADPSKRPTAKEILAKINELDPAHFRGAGDACAPDDSADIRYQPKHFVDTDSSPLKPDKFPTRNNYPGEGLSQEYSLSPETELSEPIPESEASEPISESEPERIKRLFSGDSKTSLLQPEQRQKYLEALKQKLDEEGLKTVQSPGDGWCLLHSIAMQLQISASELAEWVIARLRSKILEERDKVNEALASNNGAGAYAGLDQISDYENMITEIESHEDYLGGGLLPHVADITGVSVILFMPQGANGELATLSFHPESGSTFAIHIAHTGGTHFVPALQAAQSQSMLDSDFPDSDFLDSLVPAAPSPLILPDLPGYHEPFSNMNSLRNWIMDYTGVPLATALISHMMVARLFSHNTGLKPYW